MEDGVSDPSAQASAQVVEIATEERFERVVHTQERILVDFYAEWCAPCQSMAPVVEELAAETEASVVRVNVEEAPLVAHEYDVRSIPTFLALRAGGVVGRLVGLQTRDDIEALLD